MKKFKYLLVMLSCCLIQCSSNCDIKDFQIEHKGYSNFSISHREMYPNEQLKIIVNNKYVYKYGPEEIGYWVVSHYKLPVIAKKIEVKSVYDNKIFLNKIFFDTVNSSKEIIISVPYPKKYKNKIYNFPPKWEDIPIEESERDISLRHY